MSRKEPQVLARDNSYPMLRQVTDPGRKIHDQDQTCKHCGQIIPEHRRDSFCCHGCQYVYRLIHEAGLDKFYDLRPKSIAPQLLLFKRKGRFDWLKDVYAVSGVRVEVALEGLSCTACIWLIRALAKRRGLVEVSINTALGRLSVAKGSTSLEDLEGFLEEIQEFGYRALPLKSGEGLRGEAFEVTWRMGLVAAAVMNSMVLSFAIYLGLGESETWLFPLFTHLNFWFGTLAVLVGGSYFFRKAWAGLKLRTFHFDLPVSVGIGVAYLTSSYSHWFGDRTHVYFDTLNTFIFLMLVGRWLQTRWTDKFRSQILTADDFETLKVQRLGDVLEEVDVSELKEGDRILVAPGGMIPVEAKLIEPSRLDVDQEWLSGESVPITKSLGDLVQAGALALGTHQARFEVVKPFEAGGLLSHVHMDIPREGLRSFWQIYATRYVWFVLGLIVLGSIPYVFSDLERAIRAAVTISLVTCPCGIGIAIPMAMMMAQRRLVGRGVHLKDVGVLEELNDIERVVFDKTGTLTFSDLEILNPEVLDTLDPHDKSILFHGVAQSYHPVSRSIYHAMLKERIPYQGVEVDEIPGQGLFIRAQGQTYYAGRSDHQERFVFQKDGLTLLALDLKERLLEGGASAIRQMKAMGLQVNVLSGDDAERVSMAAKRLGLMESDVLGRCSPEDKARWLKERHPEKTLFIGDGINDLLAFDTARLKGATLSRSLKLARRADFYVSSLDLLFVPEMFKTAHRLRGVIKGNLIFSLVYNSCATILAAMGILGPLVAAITMPTVSLVVVAWSTGRMRRL